MTKNISERLSSRIINPKYFESEDFKNDFLKEKRLNSFCIKLEIKSISNSITLFGIIDENQIPQKLSAAKYSSQEKNEFTAFLDAFIDLIIERDEMQIQSFSFREIENFLRDKNDVPSLGDKETLLYAFFESTKQKVKDLFEKNETLGSNGEKRSPTIKNNYSPLPISILSNFNVKNYSELTSRDKHEFILQVFKQYISPELKKDRGDISLIFCDDSMIVVEYIGACLSCNYSLSTTLSFIQQVLRLETGNTNLLVMTDS